MNIKIKMMDPTNKVVEEKVIELPLINIKYDGDEPMNINYYTIELNHIIINVDCKGNMKVNDHIPINSIPLEDDIIKEIEDPIDDDGHLVYPYSNKDDEYVDGFYDGALWYKNKLSSL